MAAGPLFNRIKDRVRGWIDALQGKPKPEHPIIRYGTPIAFTLLGILVLIALFYSYRWYSNRQEQAAQYAFNTLIDEYIELQKQPDADYNTIAQKFAQLYAHYKNSAVGPFIASFHVDALLKAQRHDDAIAVMDMVVTALPKDPNTAALFKTKHALLLLDSVIAEKQEVGLKELEQLADNIDNPHRDYALYHLGLYHWTHNNMQQARVAWQELVDSQEVELSAPSPWVEAVSEKLATIPA